MGAGPAGAAPTDPAGGATPVYPHFYNGNVESVRDAGSDTTFFMMQQIGDVYTSAGLYGCTLNNSNGETLFNSSDPASTSTNYESFCAKNVNVATTDAVDNWDRTEVVQGVDNVGSSAGQAELCNEADGTAVPATLAHRRLRPVLQAFGRAQRLRRAADRLRQGRSSGGRLPDHRPW